MYTVKSPGSVAGVKNNTVDNNLVLVGSKLIEDAGTSVSPNRIKISDGNGKYCIRTVMRTPPFIAPLLGKMDPIIFGSASFTRKLSVTNVKGFRMGYSFTSIVLDVWPMRSIAGDSTKKVVSNFVEDFTYTLPILFESKIALTSGLCFSLASTTGKFLTSTRSNEPPTCIPTVCDTDETLGARSLK